MALINDADSELFYKANIHERRVAAFLCRAFPLSFVVLVTALAVYGAFHFQVLLLVLSAFFNVTMWLWVVSTGLISVHAALFKLNDLGYCPPPIQNENADVAAFMDDNSPAHMIVLPNYEEDEHMLAETLQSLSQAEGSRRFWIILGMEAREGDNGKLKAENLQRRFGAEFARVVVCSHPSNLVQCHVDGSTSAEVPGKASNLKYAVEQGYKECLDAGVRIELVILTVADADCIFHPSYFSEVGKDFQSLSSTGEQQYAMWQAPQFPYRNFFTSPIVSRVWGYVASTYEFGGVSSTAWGGHQMAFSSYSMPLLLANAAEPWDGDVIAEDHHAWLKSFYFSLHQASIGHPPKQGSKAIKRRSGEPALVQIRPIFLPVKSTLVETKEWWRAWVDRWGQAKRHAQGVSELSYALLATYDALRVCVLPKRMLGWPLFVRMFQAVARLFCMHVLPICQGICLGILSVKWFANNRHIAMCPDRLWFFGNPHNMLPGWWSEERYLLCGLAGAWVLVWPVVVPWALIVLSNFLVMRKVFLGAAANRWGSIWHAEDGRLPQKWASLKIFGLILFDCIFGMSWILVPYGFVVQVMAQIRIIFYGNSFSYVSAAKPMSKATDPTYGTITKSIESKGVESVKSMA